MGRLKTAPYKHDSLKDQCIKITDNKWLPFEITGCLKTNSFKNDYLKER